MELLIHNGDDETYIIYIVIMILNECMNCQKKRKHLLQPILVSDQQCVLWHSCLHLRTDNDIFEDIRYFLKKSNVF